ncbi:MAG: OmpA family protein [Thermoguttaceae bacterium]
MSAVLRQVSRLSIWRHTQGDRAAAWPTVRAIAPARLSWLLLGALAAIAGCADNPMVLKGQLSKAEQQQTMLARQRDQLQDRVNALDRDNQDQKQLLAQAQQQTQVYENQLNTTKDQLRSMTQQLAQVRAEKDGTDKRAQALAASMQRQGGVAIEANNSYLQAMPAMNIAGVNVRRAGDVIRIAIPSQTLFEPGGARLRPGADTLICDVAAEIVRTYPDQIICIEGHTDNDPIASTQWANNHAMSVSQALVVYDVLTSRTRLQANQLSVMGLGGNRPMYSATSPEAKQRNRRIELVVYPDRKG